MKASEASRSDILLIILAAANGKALSRAHLQKVAFLVSEEFNGRLPVDFYTFGKHKFGPFCTDIYNDTDMLLYRGCVRAQPSIEGGSQEYAIAERICLDSFQLDEDIRRFIKDTVAWVAGMSFSELVRAVYRLYPEFLERSEFVFDKEKAIHESFERGLMQLRDGRATLAADFIDELSAAAGDNG